MGTSCSEQHILNVFWCPEIHVSRVSHHNDRIQTFKHIISFLLYSVFILFIFLFNVTIRNARNFRKISYKKWIPFLDCSQPINIGFEALTFQFDNAYKIWSLEMCWNTLASQITWEDVVTLFQRDIDKCKSRVETLNLVNKKHAVSWILKRTFLTTAL